MSARLTNGLVYLVCAVALGSIGGAAFGAWPEHGANVFLTYVAEGFALCL